MFYTGKAKAAEKYILIPAIILFMILTLANPGVITKGVRSGMETCYYVLIPSLFPFMFASNLLYELIAGSKIGKVKILRIAMLLFFGFAGGFPIGAGLLRQMVKDGEMTQDTASGWLCGLVNPGPAFVISAVGAGLLGSTYSGVLIYVSLCISSLVCILIFANGKIKVTRQSRPTSGIGEIIDRSVSAMISLCGCVVLFSAINAASTSFIENKVVKYILCSFMEVTSGVIAAADIGGPLAIYMTCASISLCGLSTLMQVNKSLSDSGIQMRKLLLSRLLHLPFSVLILKCLIHLGPRISTNVFYIAGKSAEFFCVSPQFALFALSSCVILLFGEKTIGVFTGKKKMV